MKIYHMVIVKFKPGTGVEVPAELFAALDGLRAVVPGLESFRGGPYSSGEGLNQGFTHGFVMRFRGAAERDGYLAHPEHTRIVAMYLPMIENLIAFDFEAES